MTNAKTRLEFLLFMGVVLAGLVWRHPGLLALALPLGCHLVLAVSLASPEIPAELRATRKIRPSRALDGDILHIAVEMKNTGARTLEIYAGDVLPPGLAVVDGSPFGAAVLASGESLVFSYQVRATRGIYRFPNVRVEVRGPWSLASAQGELACPGQAVVLPRVERLRFVEAVVRRALPVPGTARARRGGLGVEFFGVREFQPGDYARKLAWKAMARREDPVVVEFAEERATEVALILDTRQRVYRDQPLLFEHAVRATGTLAQHFLRQGHRVGLLQYGTLLDWSIPGYGRRHAERLLRELARAQPGESHVFEELAHLPTRLFPAGSLLVVVSPLVLGDEETLGRLVARGYKVWAIVPEGDEPPREGEREAELARRILRLERAMLVRRAQRSGAVVLVWPVGRPLGAVVRQARRALWR